MIADGQRVVQQMVVRIHDEDAREWDQACDGADRGLLPARRLMRTMGGVWVLVGVLAQAFDEEGAELFALGLVEAGEDFGDGFVGKGVGAGEFALAGGGEGDD